MNDSWRIDKVLRQKNMLCVFSIGCVITLLFLLPFMSTLMYSIDDYHLVNIYDINMKTMWYNFYSTGRFVEGILAEIFYRLNLQPLNRPFGVYTFIIALSATATYFASYLKFTSSVIKLIMFNLLFCLNPFLIELYYYSNITVYSGIALLFLVIGFSFSVGYFQNKKIKYFIGSVSFYILSLATYQIFYPIIAFLIIAIYLKLILQNNKLTNKDFKEIITYSAIYFSSFFIFMLFLKICYLIWPPQLVYLGTDIGLFLKSIFTLEYWQVIFDKLNQFIINNHSLNSSYALLGLYLCLAVTLILYVFINKEKSKVHLFKLYFLVTLFTVIGIYACFGFGVTRPAEISSRSFTSFGIYQGTIFMIILLFLNYIDVPKLKKILSGVIIAIIIINGSLAGKAAMNTQRLNKVENNLVNRIVGRLETMEGFSSNAKILILGTTNLGNLDNVVIGDYNTFAIQSFSQVFLFNEISGYNFRLPTQEDYAFVNEIFNQLESWPSDKSIVRKNDLFIIYLGNQ